MKKESLSKIVQIPGTWSVRVRGCFEVLFPVFLVFLCFFRGSFLFAVVPLLFREAVALLKQRRLGKARHKL